MRKAGKKLIAYGMIGALTITSLFTGDFGKAGETDAKAAAKGAAEVVTGGSITGGSTSDVKIPDNPAPFRDLESAEIIEELGIGWNLGNTMDGHSNYAPGETLWQNVVTTKSLIKSVHDLGYNTIRIPVTWGNMINEDFSIDEEWMSRVEDIVDYCISENIYVMLNIHHDGAYTTGGWLNIGGDDEAFSGVLKKFNGVWKTIAERFKNYDEHMIFESMNEVYESTETGWVDDEKIVNRELARINQLNQSFVDVIRATGSNNAKRWLSVPTKNTQIKTLLEDRFDFKVPSDSINRVMVAAHNYDPWSATSTNEGKKDSYAYQFKGLKEKYVDNGIPVVIGEFGFIGTYQRPYKFEGISFLLKKYGMIGTVWDNGGFSGTGDNYGIIDRKNQAPKEKAITDGMMRGYFYDTSASQLVTAPEVKELTAFNISSQNVTLDAGSITKITVSDRQPADSNDVVLWKSENGEIASVSNGMITARAVGTTTITAFSQSGSLEKTINVTVNPKVLVVASTGITTDYDVYEMEQGGAAFLNGVSVPADNKAYVTYQSSDDAVVTVSTMGKMVALKIGSAVITATTSDGIAKEIPVTVIEPKAPEVFNVRLALNAYYNDNDHNYFATEVATDVITVDKDGTYTLRFDCGKDLSEKAVAAGVTNLNKIGSLYIKDYDVTMGNTKKSPNIPGKIRYNSIKVNDTELTVSETKNFDALKSGVFDTGNPFNVWDGSVVTEGITEDAANWNIIFNTVTEPTVVEVTFTLSGFTGKVTEPTEKPTETPSVEPTITPTTQPTSQPSIVPSSAPTDTPSPSPAAGVKKGDVKKISGAKYTVTSTKSKTVEYKGPVKKTAKKVTVPATVKFKVKGKSVTYKVTGIAQNAFKNCNKLTSVTVGKNVKKIQANAFKGCKKLKTITIKSSVLKSVGKNAFKNVSAKCKIKAPKKKLSAYKKILKKKGQKKTVKIVAA